MTRRSHSRPLPSKDPKRNKRILKIFDWSNDEWAETWLPHVRVAAILTGDNEDEFRREMGEIADHGMIPELLENLTLTAEHLLRLAELLQNAIVRSSAEIRRLGFSAENPVPDRRDALSNVIALASVKAERAQ